MEIHKIINSITEEAKSKLKPDLVKYGKNFRAISESAILDVLNPLLKEKGIYYEPYIKSYKLNTEKVYNSYDSNGNLLNNLVFIAVVHVELTLWLEKNNSSEYSSVTFEGVGMGIDVGDKAMGKAYTAAVKYALLKGFRLQYSDDPDAEKSEEIISIEPKEEPKNQKSVEKTPKNQNKAKDNSQKSEKKEPEGKASENQLSYIKGLVVKCGISDDDFEKEFGCSPYDESISMSKARKIIDRLKEIFEEGLPF